MTDESTFPLRLPRSIKNAVQSMAKEDGVSMNQFISVAVAEKIAALRTAEYFKARAEQADLATFDRLMSREGGEPPRPGDELPS